MLRTQLALVVLLVVTHGFLGIMFGTGVFFQWRLELDDRNDAGKLFRGGNIPCWYISGCKLLVVLSFSPFCRYFGKSKLVFGASGQYFLRSSRVAWLVCYSIRVCVCCHVRQPFPLRYATSKRKFRTDNFLL